MKSVDPHNRPSWLTVELFPFASRFVEIGDHTVHYVDEGTGPVLLMLHGNPTWSFLYRHLIRLLKRDFRCVAVDYPGFGLSTAGHGYDFLPASHEHVLLRFVDHLDLHDFVLFVQDWGGPIGLGLAGREPNRVRALVIGNTWAWPVSDDEHFVRFSRVLGGVAGRFAIRHFNAFVNVLIPLGVRRRKLSRAEMTAYRRPLNTAERRDPSYVFPREIVGSATFLRRVEENLHHLENKPVLLCWGDSDMAFRPRERERIQAIFPRTRVVLLRGAGHYIQEDAPEEIAAAIQSWWRASVECDHGPTSVPTPP